MILSRVVTPVLVTLPLSLTASCNKTILARVFFDKFLQLACRSLLICLQCLNGRLICSEVARDNQPREELDPFYIYSA